MRTSYRTPPRRVRSRPAGEVGILIAHIAYTPFSHIPSKVSRVHSTTFEQQLCVFPHTFLFSMVFDDYTFHLLIVCYMLFVFNLKYCDIHGRPKSFCHHKTKCTPDTADTISTYMYTDSSLHNHTNTQNQ